MPSPSAIAVWVRPLPLRMRRMRAPAKIFCSAIQAFVQGFTSLTIRVIEILFDNFYNFTGGTRQSQDRITSISQWLWRFLWRAGESNVNEVMIVAAVEARQEHRCRGRPEEQMTDFYNLVPSAPEGRFDGIERPYSPEDVNRLRGSLQVRHT